MVNNEKIGYFLITYTFKEGNTTSGILFDALNEFNFEKGKDQSTYLRETPINRVEFIKNFREKIKNINLSDGEHITGYYPECDGKDNKLYEVVF